ncbi:outer membrane lipoprotein Slp [Desulfurivibrio alkaliphilus AHT 2]|uniref:Outer membrane lipoprotein Slp n=2 Tax=Desulfurivibrio alkaliphilus TaxID=427923 RepID=D6Z5U7_DESAT|nr:outer membrane lipoprotein Slp [Desulfurivibrio alkaliphilus AHT 2]
MKPLRALLGLLFMVPAGLWLAGCATQVPAPIRQAPVLDPTPEEVRAAPLRFEEATIRWGGGIATVENRIDHALIHVVSRPLGRNGRPRDTDAGYGRFLARVPGFVDPEIFKPGRELTVSGRVAGIKHLAVGEFEYPYVLVDVEVKYLWPVHEPVRDPYHPYPHYYPFHYDPWWYDPWYDPWFPRHSPFFRPRHR